MSNLLKAQVIPFFEKNTSTAQYVVFCPETKKALALDTVLDFDYSAAKTSSESADTIISCVKEHGLTLEWILETHAHADHISAAPYIKSHFPTAKIGIGANIRLVQTVFKTVFDFPETFQTDGSQFDYLFQDGEKLQLGNLQWEVLYTPGHTPACVSYYFLNDCVFVGDTLFMHDSGTARCDFPMGSAETLWNSIQKILALPEDVRVFICHDYQPGGREILWESSIKEEKAKNIHVKEGTVKESFVEMRKKRDATLNAPKLLLPSIQVNVAGGHFPSPAPNGNIYLKLPVNVISKSENSGIVNK